MRENMKNVLSCFVVLVILMSVLPFFVTQSNAIMPVDMYMGKITGKNNDVLTVQIEYKPDYSNPHNWVSYSATSQWTISNSNAINEIRVGDYIEIAGFLGVDNEGESICIGKMKSSTEKVITDVYGDSGYLVPVHAFIEHPGVLNPPLLGDYIITYENIPDCSKYPSGSFACNVEAKYSDVTISDGNEQLKSQRLYPGRSFKYEDKGRGYNIDITFNSGEAPAYPDCTDQPCLGPQAFSDFTLHIKKMEVKKPDLIIQDIYWKPKNPSIGDTITFTVVVRNIGSADSKKCEGWGSISAGSDYDLYYFRYTVPLLAPGEKYEYRTTWKATECGELYVWASANLNMEFEESNEENNWLEKTIYIQCKEKKPDLIIQSISINPENLKPKTFLRFPVTVKNIGDGVADKSIAILFVDGSGLYGLDVDSLSAGSTQTILFDWRTECGNHEIKIFADGFREIKESNEANNNKTKTVYVKCPTKRADLVIQDISWNPSNPKQGDTVTIKTEVKNQGIADAGKFAVYWAINGMCYGRSYIYNLAAGATTTTSITWKKDWECGDIALSAIADTDDDILETSEKNNGKSEVMQVKCPPSGLIISDISMNPKNPTINDTVKFKVTVKNTGIKTIKDSYIQVDCWNMDTNNALFFIGKSCPSLKLGETCSSCKDVQVKGKGKYIVDICIKSKGSHLYKVITFTVSDKIDKAYINFIDSADSFYVDMKNGPLEPVTWDINYKKNLQEIFNQIAGDTAESTVINIIILAVSTRCPEAGIIITALDTGLTAVTRDSLTNTIIEAFKISDIKETINNETIKNSNTIVGVGIDALEANGDDIKDAYENGKDPVKLLKDRQDLLRLTYDAEIGLDNEIFNYLNQSGYLLKADDYKEIQSFLSALSLQLDLDYVVTSAVLNTYEDTPVKHISEELNHDLRSHCMPIYPPFKDQMLHCFGYLNDKKDVDEYILSIPKEFTPNIEVAGDNLEVTLKQNGNVVTNQILTENRYCVLKKHASGIYTLKVSRASAGPYDLIVHRYKIGDNYYPSVEPIERIPI